jgi:predicted transposase YbfD/YdcC
VTVDKGHGRVETRRIWTSDALNGYVTFPYAAQVACVEREVFHVRRATTTIERVYLISSLSRAEASPAQLLALNRGHWGIENRLHHVRDMAYDEDRCRARTGNMPRVLACFRNFAISLLRLFQVSNIKAALRDLAAQAHKVLTMFRL